MTNNPQLSIEMKKTYIEDTLLMTIVRQRQVTSADAATAGICAHVNLVTI